LFVVVKAKGKSMDHEAFNHFCGSFTASTYVMQWGGSHVWKIGGKVFAIGFTMKDGSAAYTFKASPRNYDFLSDCEGYRPAPYFASRGMKWIQQTDTSGALDEELTYYLSESYQIVSSGLSKRKQAELGLIQP
jgi:predicted DNA-binding protein (MmcQ/YjbR family)